MVLLIGFTSNIELKNEHMKYLNILVCYLFDFVLEFMAKRTVWKIELLSLLIFRLSHI